MMQTENSNFVNSDLKVTQLGGPKDWELNEGGKPIWRLDSDLSYYLSPKTKKLLGLDKTDGVKITLKKGFLTDGGSFNINIIPLIEATPTGKYFRAFILHDGIARTKYFSFKDTNRILDNALELLSMSSLYRRRIFYPLQWFGSPTTDSGLLKNAEEFVKIEFYKIKV